MKPPASRPELDQLIREAVAKGVDEDEFLEQWVSFIYGNAPEGSRITKDSARAVLKKLHIAGA